MPTSTLLAGAAEVDITPPVGTALAGNLWPRRSVGIEDPLYVKALVLESGGTKIACVVFDLLVVLRSDGDRCVQRASERTGIPPDHIVWAATHTHTGPYTGRFFDDDSESVVDEDWLCGLPDKCAEAVARADAARVPVRMSRVRGFRNDLGHNRRLLFKDGRAINTWNLPQIQDHNVQCLSSAGPIDPEVSALVFEEASGRAIAVLFHYALHANTNFGDRFSGDYPAVVAAHVRERLGPQVCTVFLPGTCADINSIVQDHHAVGDRLAETILDRFDARTRYEGDVPVSAARKRITVPYRDFSADQEDRIRGSGWSADAQRVFRREVDAMRREGSTQAETVIQAWRIGDVGFASLPGEAFVELGVRIKRQSPFPWTLPVGLGGDWLGYLVTPQAWDAGGYESLVSRVARPSVEGVQHLVDGAVDLLKQLYSQGV